MATNPLISQGSLNRLISSVVVHSTPTLNISASNMGKNFLSVTLDANPFVTQIETGVGIVNSLEPYEMATITVDLLKTQSLGNSWKLQSENTSILGNITVYPDVGSGVLGTYYFGNCSIIGLDPNAFDGKNPVFRLVIKGVYYINNAAWNLA
ncbi:MAG: hypothetical protein ACYDBI_06115 [Thermoplasmataceae archaeon]